jgi:hypothetical protein
MKLSRARPTNTYERVLYAFGFLLTVVMAVAGLYVVGCFVMVGFIWSASGGNK